VTFVALLVLMPIEPAPLLDQPFSEVALSIAAALLDLA
jgi:hypothetical protein